MVFNCAAPRADRRPCPAGSGRSPVRASATRSRPMECEAFTSTTSPLCTRSRTARTAAAASATGTSSPCQPGTALAPASIGAALIADHDQPGQPGRRNGRADLLVQLVGVVAKLGHVAEHGEAAAASGHGRERRDGGPHGVGIRVIGVVHDRDAVRQPGDFHAPAAPGDSLAQPGGDVGHGQAELAGQRSRGQRVAHVVLAMQLEPHRSGPARQGQREPGPAKAVGGYLLGPHVGLRRSAERHHSCRCPPGHRRHPGVVSVQDRDPVRRQRGRELAFRLRDPLQAAELASVRVADAQHRAEPGRSDLAQCGDMAKATGG